MYYLQVFIISSIESKESGGYFLFGGTKYMFDSLFKILNSQEWFN